MRKRGSYIIDYRLKFKKGMQKEFLTRIKEKSGKTWMQLANELDIHRHTLCSDWLSEKITIPKSIAFQLISTYKFERWSFIRKDWIKEELPPKWGQIKAGDKNKKAINTPDKNEFLAEFIGAALGDGHLDRKEFNLSSDTSEIIYINYIKKLIWKLFKLESKIFINKLHKNNTFMDTYSTELIKFLTKNGLVIGDKIKNKASVPNWIFEDKLLIYAALRGLFDTDGGIYNKQKGYKRAIIEFQTNSETLNKDILNMLKIINFKPSKGDNGLNIRIQDQEEIRKFFNLIGSSNPKNIIRYEEFLKYGYIPLRSEIARKMKDFKGNIPFKAPLV